MIAVTIRPYEDGNFSPLHQLEMADGHENYRSAVFLRQTGIICHNTFLVATLDTEQIGYTIAALVQRKPHEAWILWMGVREDQRRNGVGSVLLTELLDVLRTLGVRFVRVTVSPWNTPAHGLFLKAEFVQESYREAYFDKDEDRIVMIKELE